MPAAQFKALWDATGGLWQKGALAGKSVGVFFSTASQGGGQETTAFTCEPTARMTAAAVAPLCGHPRSCARIPCPLCYCRRSSPLRPVY
jgi:hypothetical protein